MNNTRLAERYTKKNISSPSLNASNEDYKLYLSFLIYQNKYKDSITTTHNMLIFCLKLLSII